MKNILFKAGMAYALLTHHSLYAEEKERFLIVFSDNVTLTGGPNDMGPTGELRFAYTDPDDRYRIDLDWELYVNSDPMKPISDRGDPDNIRTDALRLSFLQGDARFKYGIGIEILGDLGGKTFQNNIHDLAGDRYIPADYLSGYKVTPTLNAAYRDTYRDGWIDLYAELRFPLVVKHGIIDLRITASHTEKDLFGLGMDAGLGVNLDCSRYPDSPEFSGYPLRDFKVCTPQSIVTLGYGSFSFFWEIPLINSDVQNSVMGIRYGF